MKNEYLDFIEALQRLYLENNDMDKLLSCIDEETSWIGTGRQEICKTLSQATQALLLKKTEYNGGFSVTDSWYETRLVAPDVCVVYGEFSATANDPTAGVADLHQRLSAVCAKREDGIKLLHLHMSTPNNDQQSGEYYVKNEVRADHQTLRRQYAQTTKDLLERSRELDILTANIPGGVHECKNDEEFTLVSMSGGFLAMFGYTQEEVESLYGNCYRRMIYEGDREIVAAAMREQLVHGPTVELEYRVQCKNDSLMWVLERSRLVTSADGTETLFCMMLDITKRKAEDEKLRLVLERHKVIMDQASDIIFEWDIVSNTLDFSANWEKRFGYPPITRDVTKNVPLSKNIYPEDISCFSKLLHDIAGGVPYAETEFRIRNSIGEYSWCRVRATTQFSNDRRPIKAVGVIVDIEEEKTKSSILMEAAQRDSLTQLYNKNATKARVEKIMADTRSGMLHALMIIDVDNFKSINDRFGHQCGDAVLANMAKALKKLFRTTDVVGRIGGDEFLVFMGNASTLDLVATKAREIVRIFSDMPTEIGEGISCSVGVSSYPRDGKDYAALSRCADKALYGVKQTGKENFAFYDKDLCEKLPYSAARTAINGRIDSEETVAVNQSLLQHIFGLLYSASDIRLAINHILQTVGTAYGVSRAYIFENSEDGSSCSNTFEWCNEGVAPEMDQLQNLSFATDLAGFFELYDEHGVFYCQDISTLNPQLRSVLERQGIVSVLQCFIQDSGVFKGYIGFDDCTENRYWTKEQVSTLSMVANMVSTFLVKQWLNQELVELKSLK